MEWYGSIIVVFQLLVPPKKLQCSKTTKSEVSKNEYDSIVMLCCGSVFAYYVHLIQRNIENQHLRRDAQATKRVQPLLVLG